MSFGKRLFEGAALVAYSMLVLPPAQAQDATKSDTPNTAQLGPQGPQANILEEIVVTTVRKRSENVQRTPVAVTVINAKLLSESNITNSSQIGALAPNLQIARSSAISSQAFVYLRGFGSVLNDPASDPHVATYLDGIYQPTAQGNEFDTFNVDSIEVQAGPQGTLLGKNAPVGAIYITSQKPNGKYEGSVEADYGAYAQWGTNAKVNIPLIKNNTDQPILAANVGYSHRAGGNWVHNIADGKDDAGGFNENAVRVGIAFEPSDSFSWVLHGLTTWDMDPQSGGSPKNNAPGLPGTSTSATQVQPYPCFFQQNVPGFAAILNNQGCISLPYGQHDSLYTKPENQNLSEISSNINYKLEPVTLTLVNGLISYFQIDRNNAGGTSYVNVIDVGNRTTYDSESAEFRISSNNGGGWDLGGILEWVVGGYVSNFHYEYANHLGLGVLGGPEGIPFIVPIGYANDNQYEIGTTQSEAAFAHVIAHLSDALSGSFGVRQSWDQKTHSFQADTSLPMGSDIPAGFHNTSFEAGAAYQFDRDKMVYFRFGEGYEAGGYPGLSHGDVYEPELDQTYEIGLKSDWLDKRLRVNVDLFDNEISQLQLSGSLPTASPPFYIEETRNAGSATIQGIEAEITSVPADNVTVFLNTGYLFPRYDVNLSTVCSNKLGTSVDCSGLPFTNAPKWTIRLGANYDVDLPRDLGTATFSADVNYKSSLYTDDPPLAGSFQNDYATVNLSVTLHDSSDKYSLKFYGTNVTDKHYSVSYINAGGIGAWDGYGRPAEWGVRLTAKFGPFDD